MKDGTEAKLKFKALQKALGLALWQARGLLDTLWSFARHNSPRGDIGRFCADDIALGIGWEGESSVLIGALLDTRWLDKHNKGMLVIHDWAEHCEDSVHKQLARSVETFYDGRFPKLTRLEKSERERLEPLYRERYRNYGRPACVRRASGVRRGKGVKTPQPIPEPSHTSTKPEPCLALPERNTLSGKPDRAGDIRAVFQHYRALHPNAHKSPKPAGKEWRLIAARMDEGYTAADLCAAIDGCHRCPHNQGENDRGLKYLDLELIVRTSSHVARYMEVPLAAQVTSELEKRNHRAGAEWLASKEAEDATV